LTRCTISLVSAVAIFASAEVCPTDTLDPSVLKGLILEHVETHLDSGDDLPEFGVGARKKPLPNLTTLELITFDDSYNQNPFEAPLFPALRTIIDHRRLEPDCIGFGIFRGSYDFVVSYKSVLPQLTSLYLNHVDEYLLPSLKKCTNLLLLDLPLEPFAASVVRAIAHDNHIPTATRILPKSPHTILPPQLRALRIHHVALSDKYDFDPEEVEEGMADAEGIVGARLQKGSGVKGKGKLEVLVLPGDAGWVRVAKIAKEKGARVKFEPAEFSAEGDVALFKELQGGLSLA